MNLPIPSLSLVVLVGPSGSGKSSFARRHFLATEVLSSDTFRGLVSDDENDQTATPAAFEALHFVLRKRLEAGHLTVVDATNVQSADRKALIAIAREYHAMPAAILLDMPVDICVARNDGRPDRKESRRYVHRQHMDLRRSVGRGDRQLRHEGFREVFRLCSPEEVDSVTIERTRMWCDKRERTGPFDLIGDVHGCLQELEDLLALLGYERTDSCWNHPEGRTAIFLGDLVDRGPASLATLETVWRMTQAGNALCVPGNHEAKFLRALRGNKVSRTHGLERTMAELEALDEEGQQAFKAWAIPFLEGLVSHLVLDGGSLVAAHAGMKESMQGRGAGAVREFALFGETTGETDEYGLPVRHDWARDYRGRSHVIYGHTPTLDAEWINQTLCLDTGCAFGGKLTALRWPEKEIVSVPARRIWCEPVRPLAPAQPEVEDGLLDLGDLSGRRHISTRLLPTLVIPAEQTMAAIESTSRFGADPRWIIHLPPTMSPAETSSLEGFLEHPAEAFAYYRKAGLNEVVCQRKHMGSRCLAIACRDQETARRRFGVESGSGLFYTRTGRRFFDDASLEATLLDTLRSALDHAGFWEEFQTDWFCLDGEMMPWSAKAQELLKLQYAAAGAAGTVATSTLTAWLEEAQRRDLPVSEPLTLARSRQESMERFVQAWRGHCWPVESPADYRWAPFHLLACEGKTFFDKSHAWHMDTLGRLCDASESLLLRTEWRRVDLTDPASEEEAIGWWLDLTAAGGEGMVIKPTDFVTSGNDGLVQPAIKCRGREYLRIIYGPDYLEPEHIKRLRKRGLGRKRSLAAREFALGIEALERFVRREPLRKTHECVLGVLALESEPVDPRL